MKSKYAAVLLGLMVSFFASAQNNGLVKVYAFSQTVQTGAPMAVEEGQPDVNVPATKYLIYVETPAGKAPVITGLYVGNKLYTLEQSALASNKKDSPGTIAKTGKASYVKAAGTNLLWLFECTERQEYQRVKPPLANVKSGQLILAGLYKGKAFYQLVPMVTKLAKEEHQ